MIVVVTAMQSLATDEVLGAQARSNGLQMVRDHYRKLSDENVMIIAFRNEMSTMEQYIDLGAVGRAERLMSCRTRIYKPFFADFITYRQGEDTFNYFPRQTKIAAVSKDLSFEWINWLLVDPAIATTKPVFDSYVRDVRENPRGDTIDIVVALDTQKCIEEFLVSGFSGEEISLIASIQPDGRLLTLAQVGNGVVVLRGAVKHVKISSNQAKELFPMPSEATPNDASQQDLLREETKIPFDPTFDTLVTSRSTKTLVTVFITTNLAVLVAILGFRISKTQKQSIKT